MKYILTTCFLICIPISLYSNIDIIPKHLYTDIISEDVHISSDPSWGNDILLDNAVIHVTGTVHIQGTSGHPVFISTRMEIERGCRINVSGKDTHLYLSQVYLKDLDSGLCVTDGAHVYLTDVWIENMRTGMSIYSGIVEAERVYISNIGITGVYVSPYGKATFVDSEMRNIHTAFLNSGDLSLRSVFIHDNNEAIVNVRSLSIQGASFEGNGLGVVSLPEVEIIDTWWGTSSVEIRNKTIVVAGQGISLTNELVVGRDTPYTKCCKEILFFPGMQASRIVDEDNQLWEPNTANDIRTLFMNEGSLDRIGVVSHVIDEINILPIFRYNIYKTFLETLSHWKQNKVIGNYTIMPYDWRLPVDVIADQHITQLKNTLIPGKRNAVLIGHSNGGLVIKSILKKLEMEKKNRESNYIDAIQQVIYIAVPHDGTPKALFSLLHGYEQGIPLILKPALARQLAYALPGVYGLLPSAMSITSSIVSSNTSADFIDNTQIDTPDAYTSFIHNDFHVSSSSSNISIPMKVSDSIYTASVHLMDTIRGYIPPMKVTNIVGTGLQTPSAIEYMIRDATCIHIYAICTKGAYVSYSVHNTNDGDGTVLQQSAQKDAQQSISVDLKSHNAEERDVDHANILESDAVIQMIRSLVEDTKAQFVQNEYIFSRDYVFTDTTPYYSLQSFSPVEIHMYDEEGRHTGIKEQTEIYTIIDTDIPDSEYYAYGDSEQIIVPKGSYIVSVKGVSDGWFSLALKEMQGRNGEESLLWETEDIQISGHQEFSLSLSDNKPVLQEVVHPNKDVFIEQSNGGTRVCRYNKIQIQRIQYFLESISIYIDPVIYQRWRKAYPALYKQAC